VAATSPCQPCCTTPAVTNTPGIQGAAGINGTSGKNAYTTTNGQFTLPAINANASVTVLDTGWMVVGQIIVIGAGSLLGNGPATFQVVTISTSTSFTGKFLAYPGDQLSGTIATGSSVGPSGSLPGTNNFNVNGTGAVYSLTATAALLNMGTTPPTLTLTAPGTYLIFGRARFDWNSATLVTGKTITMKLRRTNNTPADLTFVGGTIAQAAYKLPVGPAGTLAYTAAAFEIPPTLYTTLLTTDIVQLWGSMDVIPSPGTVDTIEASLIALRIA
jgi:hypothetical protein